MRRLAILAMAAAFPLVLSAAQLTLRDGTVFNGTFVQGNSNTIDFQDTAGIHHRFDVRDVQMLDFGGPYGSYSTTTEHRTIRESESSYTYPPGTAVVPSGAQIVVRTNEPIDSYRDVQGQSYSALLERDVTDRDGYVLIPRGSEARLVVRRVESASAFGSPTLVLDLDSVRANGRMYRVSTFDVTQSGRAGIGANRRTAEMVGGGAVLGTLLGALVGGGRGAAIGGLTGAVGGGAVQVLTRGREVRVPAETELTFQLEQPLHLEPV